jgi:peptide/nickel transport system ATP-binding protein
MTRTLIAAEGVTKAFGRGDKRVLALDQVDFAVPADGAPIIAVAGESGSGKTTLASLLLGFEQPTGGRITFEDQDLATASAATRQTFRREVQAVFQDPFAVYNPFYRVDRALLLPIRSFKLVPRDQEREAMAEACRAVGLNPADTLGRYPHQLSGGQRQRLMIARALLVRPRLIIADEPVSMVDASLRATILSALKTLNQELKVPIVYISHDLTTAFHIADQIAVLYRGRIVEAGRAETVIRTPAHPYTKLLVDAIAWADRDRVWGSATPRAASPITAMSGCSFAPRCPDAAAVCATGRPPLIEITPDQRAACRLYQPPARTP